MNISKVYYEELKSKCVGGKWESVRIGAEVHKGEYDTATACITQAKEFVHNMLNKELGYDVKKNEEVKKLVEELNKEVQCLLATL